jgi:hypothetical protein
VKKTKKFADENHRRIIKGRLNSRLNRGFNGGAEATISRKASEHQ